MGGIGLVHIKSLGYQTDLIFPAFEGEIADRGDYVVVRTPSNPTFYWGNFLLFSNPPGQGDFVKWRLFDVSVRDVDGVQALFSGELAAFEGEFMPDCRFIICECNS